FIASMEQGHEQDSACEKQPESADPRSNAILGFEARPERCLRFRKPQVSGGDFEEATPDPIPNSEVKLFGADGTARVAVWESRTPPGLFLESPRVDSSILGLFAFCPSVLSASGGAGSTLARCERAASARSAMGVASSTSRRPR